MDSRIEKLQKIFAEQSLDAVLISSTPNIYYLTGYGGFVPEERDAYILVTPHKGYIFTHALYAEAMGTAIPHLSLVEMTRDKPFAEAMKRLLKEHGIKKLGIESENLTVAEYQKLTPLSIELSHVNLSKLRTHKEAKELENIQRACALTDDAFDYILNYIKPGMTEQDVEYAISKYFTNHDAQTSFRSIVAFGKNASVPHHLSGQTKLKEQDVVLIDFGAKVNFYCADVSRTFFVGEPPAKQEEMYQVAYEAQQAAITFIEDKLAADEKISAFDTDKIARDYIVSKGYPAFPYSLGHGVAIEIHEYPLINPRSKANLESGMVFTLEPGIHIPREFGVRIEDVFTIQGNKLIKLTHSQNTLVII